MTQRPNGGRVATLTEDAVNNLYLPGQAGWGALRLELFPEEEAERLGILGALVNAEEGFFTRVGRALSGGGKEKVWWNFPSGRNRDFFTYWLVPEVGTVSIFNHYFAGVHIAPRKGIRFSFRRETDYMVDPPLLHTEWVTRGKIASLYL